MFNPSSPALLSQTVPALQISQWCLEIYDLHVDKGARCIVLRKEYARR